MKIGFNPGSIVDSSGAPLQGRVLVYVHDSLEKKDIYTMQGSEYVASENPVLLDTTGRIPTTLFFDVGVVDVLVQKYVGEPGHLADESPDDDFEDFDRFEAGFDFDPEKEASRTVETIADLKDIDNPSGVVRVNCYTTPGDTFPRYYLWNPNCTASEDGGCVIADSHDASGMWCYLCEGESIKSSVYGIKPGTDEANIGAFCGAPLSVSGDYVITYPASLYFERGTYSQTTTSIMVSNNRTAVFSCGAKFPTATIIAYDVDVDGVCLNYDYIADFVIPQSQYENSATIRSSWCRTIGGFWRSNAKHLILDRNHLSNDVITSKIDISEAIVEGVYFTSTYTFTSGAYLNFDKCHFVGAKWIFREGDRLKFTDCNFTDDLFWSINTSTIDFGAIATHHIDVDDWKITDSDNADVWMVWANATGKTYVDLCGRTVSLTFTNSSINQISNGVMTGTIATNVNLVLENIGGNPGVYPLASGKTLVARRCNNLTIVDSALPFSNIDVFDCNMVLNRVVDSSDTYYFQRGGSVQGTFKCAGWDSGSGEPAAGNNIALFDCFAHIGNYSWFNKLTMRNCEVDGVVHIIPFFESGTPKLYADLSDSTFQNGVAFTDSSVGNTDVYDIEIAHMFIVNNRFGDVLSMPFMSTNAGYKYLASGQSATYKGNVGSCPLENFNERFNYDMLAMSDFYIEDPAGFSSYKCTSVSYGIFNINPNDVYHHGDAIRLKSGAAYGYESYYLHDSAIANTNDQFTVRIACKTTDYDATSTFKVFDE